MPVINDPMRLPGRRGTIYPKPLDAGFDGRMKRALTEGLGLTQFGVNLTTLRTGRAVLASPLARQGGRVHLRAVGRAVRWSRMEGEHILKPGMAAGFPAGEEERAPPRQQEQLPATYLEIGTRSPDEDATYPEVDLEGGKERRQVSLLHEERRALRMKLTGITLKAPIHVYRWTLKPLIGMECRHLPTCSEYALEAIDKNGAWKGFWLMISRLCRCHPWGTAAMIRRRI